MNDITILALVIVGYVVGYLHAKSNMKKMFEEEVINLKNDLNKKLPPDKQIHIDIEYEKKEKKQ